MAGGGRSSPRSGHREKSCSRGRLHGHLHPKHAAAPRFRHCGAHARRVTPNTRVSPCCNLLVARRTNRAAFPGWVTALPCGAPLRPHGAPHPRNVVLLPAVRRVIPPVRPPVVSTLKMRTPASPARRATPPPDSVSVRSPITSSEPPSPRAAFSTVPRRATPRGGGRGYRRSTMARANSLVLTSVAPSMRRAKS